MDDLARFCCQNSECILYSRRNAGNLSVCARYGKQNHIRLLYCNACKGRFSERKGTALFHSHLPEEKALAVFQHLDSFSTAGSSILISGTDLTHQLDGVAP